MAREAMAASLAPEVHSPYANGYTWDTPDPFSATGASLWTKPEKEIADEKQKHKQENGHDSRSYRRKNKTVASLLQRTPASGSCRHFHVVDHRYSSRTG
jgi:hypothetical protein